jgi:pyruvate kinase
LKVSDGIMVARGDLGVSSARNRAGRQKQLTRAARGPKTRCRGNANARIHDREPVPTRAEVSDVATAVMKVPTPSCCRLKVLPELA